MTDPLSGAPARPATVPPLAVDYAAVLLKEGSSTLSSIAFACSMLFLPACLAAGMVHPDIPEALVGALIGLPLAGFVMGLVAKRRTAAFGKPRWRAKSAVVVGGIELGLVMVVALLLPSLCRAREPANRVKCANNLRQIGFALLDYANGHGGQFPPTLAALISEPQVDITADCLICPSSMDSRVVAATTEQQAHTIEFEPGHLSYIYVGQGLMSNQSTPTTVLAYDNPHNHGDAGINVLYGDGHVEFLEKKDADRMRAELQSGYNPPRAR